MDGHDSSLDRAGDPDARPLGDRTQPPLSEAVLQAVTEKLSARLARTHDVLEPLLSEDFASQPTTTELDTFCDALVSADPAAPQDFFMALSNRGLTPDALCLRWIAPAARRLGERWVADDCGFLEVTLGSTRLHGLLRSVGASFIPDATRTASRPAEMSALFAGVPGETHVLGVTMAAEFFRRAGWRVDLHCLPDLDDLIAAASTGNYTLIGLSGGCGATLSALKDTVEGLREASPDVKIVLGGYVTELHPDFVEISGVDDVMTDLTVAPIACQSLILPS